MTIILNETQVSVLAILGLVVLFCALINSFARPSQKKDAETLEKETPEPAVADNAAARAARAMDKNNRIAEEQLALGDEIFNFLYAARINSDLPLASLPGRTREDNGGYLIYNLSREPAAAGVRISIQLNEEAKIIVFGNPHLLGGKPALRFQSVDNGRRFCREVLAEKLYSAS